MQDRYFYPKIQAFTRVSGPKALVFMTVLHSLDALREWQQNVNWFDKKTSFVPTMGALHEGHVSLIRKASELGELVVVSILVNPTQFNDAEDFQSYPRTLERDTAMAQRAGAHAVFAPQPEDLYRGTPKAVRVKWGNLTDAFEGAHRPGQFDGVVAVVNLLFESVRPSLAVFGEKDLQQVAVVKRLARERHPALEVVVGELIRDANGLALSSRNARLDSEGLKLALTLSRALTTVREGWADERPMSEVLMEARAALEATPGLTLEYLDAVNGNTFESHSRTGAAPTHVVIAAHVQGVRLIDNVTLRT